jgi:hypothetical protein
VRVQVNCYDASGTQLSRGDPWSGPACATTNGLTCSFSYGPGWGGYTSLATADHFGVTISYPAGGAFIDASADVHIDWDGTLPVVCAYGSEKNNPSIAALESGWGLLDTLGLISHAPWALPIILAQANSPLYLDTICSQPPPPDPTINLSDWITPSIITANPVAVDKVMVKFSSHIWQQFCR